VPVEAGAGETGHEVHPTLVHVHVRAENLSRPVGQARVTHQLGDQLADPVHLEDRPDLVGLALHDGALVGLQSFVRGQPGQLAPVRRHLGGVEQTVHDQIAVGLETGQFGRVERAGLADRAGPAG
jgi:hypothetical protein